MQTIYKYSLDVDDLTVIAMPRGARILCLQTQNGEPQIWALVNSTAPKVKRKIAVRGTGHPADEVSAAAYIGTFQMHGGALVFHVFDRGEAE